MACMIMSLPLLLFWILIHSGTSLAVQWSCLSFHRREHGFLSGQGTKIPTGGQEKKRKEKTLFHSEKRDASERVPGRKAAAAAALQSCPTLCHPIDSSPPGSPIPGILQARTLAWDAISFSDAWKWKVKVKSLSRVQLLATLWTAAHQAPQSMGFSRWEYCSGVLLPSPGGKAGDLQMEAIGCNHHKFFLSLCQEETD